MKRVKIMAVLMAAGLLTCIPVISAAQPGAQGKAPAQPQPKDSTYETGTVTGKVLNTMNAGSYTYFEMQKPDKKRVWVAVLTTKLAVGDTVSYNSGMVMKKFTSKALNRTFESIIFTDFVTVQGKGKGKMQAQTAPPPSPEQPLKPKVVVTVKPGSIKKFKGGYTVEEIFAKRESLKAKTVSVRGKVVNYSDAILGKNWLHIQDGSGIKGTNDLAVTTEQTANIGDVVVVTGPISVAKDFGMGYYYDAIMEDATIKKE